MSHLVNITAVDPRGCGCTECIVGEYVPLEVFEASATVFDLLAVAVGDVRNSSGVDIIREPAYTDASVKEYQRRVLSRDSLRIPDIAL